MAGVGDPSGRPVLALSALNKYLVRFAFGAGIALVAGIVGMTFGPKAGGLFLAFPAILPASLTLIEEKGGRGEAAVDSEGAMLGAIALVVFAVLVSLTVARWGVVISLALSIVAWAVLAIALYKLVMATFHHEPSPP
ncbi:MAG: DUF3147 family protein [Chloroflexi bacterium]|nr:MAG: DUF3147 family protein [Chloroflexota bacterium]